MKLVPSDNQHRLVGGLDAAAASKTVAGCIGDFWLPGLTGPALHLHCPQHTPYLRQSSEGGFQYPECFTHPSWGLEGHPEVNQTPVVTTIPVETNW